MNSYKGITFAEGYKKSFADFKKEFGSTHIFNDIHPEHREQELEKAYDIAMTKSAKEIEVVEEKIVETDGNASRSIDQSKENATDKVAK